MYVYCILPFSLILSIELLCYCASLQCRSLRAQGGRTRFRARFACKITTWIMVRAQIVPWSTAIQAGAMRCPVMGEVNGEERVMFC